MKDSLVKSLIELILKVKGKKPVVIAVTLAVFALGYYAVQKGYISQELFDSGILTDQVDSILDQSVVDTLNTVDTLIESSSESIK